jgi:hypothetical protein
MVPFARAEVIECEAEETEEGIEEAARVNQQAHQHLREGHQEKANSSDSGSDSTEARGQ